MLIRSIFVALLLLSSQRLIAWKSSAATVVADVQLAALPMTLDGWSGSTAPPFDNEIIRVLGVEQYIHRVYRHQAGGPVWLYVGYHGSQSEGDSIHSPMNCLPGAGWEPVERVQVQLNVLDSAGRARAVDVNELIIQKGASKQAVIYWYQSHGRVVASEYWSKAFTVFDTIRSGRSDAAFVRVIVPVGEDPAAAKARARKFAADAFPQLSGVLPG